jgi:hypothetical protein
MAEIILDMTGQAGLAYGFAGDADQITPTPHLLISAAPGQMAQGLYNPYLRKGYMAPVTTTVLDITSSPTVGNYFTSVEYDQVHNKVYWGERGRSIYVGDSLTDSSLTEIIELPSGQEIQDLDLYEINSRRSLFYVYSKDEQVNTKSLSESGRWENISVRVDPLSTTKPSIIKTDYTFGNLGTSHTKTITVPVSTNVGAIVFITSYSEVTGVTVGGNAMTQVAAYSILEGSSTRYDYVYARTYLSSGSTNIVITRGVDTSASAHYLLINEVAGTPIVEKNLTASIGSTLVTKIQTSSNSLYLNFSIAELNRFRISTAAASATFATTAQNPNDNGTSVFISNNGTKMYVEGGTAGAWFIYQYTLGTAWNVSTATYDSKSYNYTAQINGILGKIKFSPNGLVMVLSNESSSSTTVQKYDLSVPWDVSTAVYNAAHSYVFTPTEGGTWYGFDISQDGGHIYFTDGSSIASTVKLKHFTLSTAWNLSTASLQDEVDVPLQIFYMSLAANDKLMVLRGVNSNKFDVWEFDALRPFKAEGLKQTSDTYTFGYSSTSCFIPEAGNFILTRRGTDSDVMSLALTNGGLPSISTSSKKITGRGETSFFSAVYEEDNGKSLEIGVAELPFSGVSDNTWLSETINTPLSSTSGYNFIRLADNGFAYLFANNKVHKIDGGITGGEKGSITKNVLLFPEYFTITDAVDYRSRLYMAVHQYPVDTTTTTSSTFVGVCGIVVWNKLSTQLGGVDFIEVPGVREIKKIYTSPDGVLKLITISDNGLTELRQFGYNDSGGVVFPKTQTFGIGAFPQYPDGLTVIGDKVSWVANDGKIYCESQNAVTQMFELKAAGATSSDTINNITSGALFYGSGSQTASAGFRSNKQALTVSYIDAGIIRNRKFYPFDLRDGSNDAQAVHQGDVYTGVQYIPVTSVIRNVRVYNAPIVGTGTDVVATVKLYFNQSSSVSMTKTVTKDEAKRGYVDFKINKPYLNAIQIEVEWATAVPLGADTYLPSVAVITHDPTTTQSPDNG